MDSLLNIFEFAFMQRAFIAGIAIGIVAPSIGLFTVVKRYSLLADAMAHISLVGASLGLLMGINPVLSSITTSVIAGVTIEKIRNGKQLLNESVIAIFLSGSLALAVLIFSTVKSNFNILNYLFGSLITISSSQVLLITIFALFVIATIILFFNQFFLIAFDETLARAQGLNVQKYNILLMIVVSITVGIAMQAMGILLTGALMIIPPITAMQLGQDFKRTLLFSIVFGLLAVIIGIYSAFYLNLPIAATIVIVAIIQLIITAAFKRSY